MKLMFLYPIIFMFGLTIGSFLNAVIYRLYTGESIVRARSHCPKCGHILEWRELVPVISFIVQRGKCRACGKAISFQYPLIELSTGAIFLMIFSYSFEFLYLSIISSFLIIIFVYDLRHYIIPDKIIYPAIIIAGIWQLLSGDMLYTIYAAAGASSVFAAIYFVSRGKWMGFGDVKLAFFMGLFLGWPNILVALFIAFILGGIIGIFLIAISKKSLKSQVPFGPFLITGTFIAMFWGKELIQWYLGLII